tara:strand:- start:669 stop:1121 length:453 start_codon:yes stop_codon:yes gene_type:complete
MNIEETIQLNENSFEITIEKSNLNNKQKLILKKVYYLIKGKLLNIMNLHKNEFDRSEITKSIFDMICIIIKNVENIKINNKPLSGNDKKLIALELGRIFINTEIINNNTEISIIEIYNLIAESILENIIDVSNEVNVVIEKGCKKLFSCF